MRIRDPIYGDFTLSDIATLLASTPEFRRLSQIRLLNTLSPTLATLGEIRRYSHTLGVLFLSSQSVGIANQFTSEELNALQAAIILHDIGTPPFGHLLEYVYKERFGWDHESAIIDMLRGWHASANVAHQIFGKRTGKVMQLLRGRGVTPDLLMAVLQKKHPLSKLILGTLDFDNVDNVVRMAWALGLSQSRSLPISVAAQLSVHADGELLFPRASAAAVRKWLDLRSEVYDVIVFDASTVAAQAVLTKALISALDNGVIDLEDWVLTDEQLLERLSKHPTTKNFINLQYLGVLPRALFIAQFSVASEELAGIDRIEFVTDLERLAEESGIDKPLAYVFKDRGTFGKQLHFVDSESGERWSIGETTSSLVAYLFSHAATDVSGKTLNELVLSLGRKWKLLPGDLVRLIINGSIVIGRQGIGEIDFASH